MKLAAKVSAVHGNGKLWLISDYDIFNIGLYDIENDVADDSHPDLKARVLR